MKIWLLNHYAGEMLSAKGGRHYYFSEYLKRMGHEPVVFCCNIRHWGGGTYIGTNALWTEKAAENIRVPFIFVKAREYSGNGAGRVINMAGFCRNVKKAAIEYSAAAGAPDIILASSVHPLTLIAGIQLAKRFGVKCICEIRDLWPESIIAYSSRWTKRSLFMKLLYCGEKKLYEKSDAVVMTWPGGYEYICEQGWEKAVPRDKVFHISNGVDLAEYRRLAEENVFEDAGMRRETRKKFVYTGSVRKVNNLRLLVGAARVLKRRGFQDAVIFVFGGGDEREALERIVREESLDNIIFKGRIDRTLVPSVLAQADFTVLHNTSTILDRYGQSQNKLFEYLASGKPILMTYSVGHSIIKKYRCGMELAVQTPEHIADGIMAMCGYSQEEYDEQKRGAGEAAKEFDYPLLTEKLESVIQSVRTA
ncbi:MAG: glycosyltransferase family 4 protein [Oscillospiraceae bacterium]|nr:glycosyltransferase family 4 protein [Oscillospiraceae bacterium]